MAMTKISVRVDEDLLARLKERAARHEVLLASEVRDLLRYAVTMLRDECEQRTREARREDATA